MPADLLEFEEPIGVLLKEVEALSMLPATEDRWGPVVFPPPGPSVRLQSLATTAR